MDWNVLWLPCFDGYSVIIGVSCNFLLLLKNDGLSLSEHGWTALLACLNIAVGLSEHGCWTATVLVVGCYTCWTAMCWTKIGCDGCAVIIRVNCNFLFLLCLDGLAWLMLNVIVTWHCDNNHSGNIIHNISLVSMLDVLILLITFKTRTTKLLLSRQLTWNSGDSWIWWFPLSYWAIMEPKTQKKPQTVTFVLCLSFVS